MLTALKDYLARVDSQTLCIECNLYENLTSIQYSCLYNNTIPEAHCFAFDFVANKDRDSTEGAWDLIYTEDQKTFFAKTNQKTHNVIRQRFADNCVPDWVVKNNLSLSSR